MKELSGEEAARQSAPRKLQKTPMFTAAHAGRYGRQELIREIDQIEQTSLICYVAGDATEIDRDDTMGFVDLLHNIGPNDSVDLLLHTSGGQVDACEKLIRLIQANVGDARLRIIVPEMAKSAGTILALIADEILMSATSELGMIDPQFPMKDSQGNIFRHSVVVFLKEFDRLSANLSGNQRDHLTERMLLDFDSKVVVKFRGIEARIRNLAEALLKRKSAQNYTAIANELLNSNKWRTHGQPISGEDAKDIGLPVRIVPMNDVAWQRYLALYCLQRQIIGRGAKLFESSYVSRVVEAEHLEE